MSNVFDDTWVDNPLKNVSENELSRRITTISSGSAVTVVGQAVHPYGTIVRFWQHAPQFPGDRFYVDIEFDSGWVCRAFDVTGCIIKPAKEEKKTDEQETVVEQVSG